MTSKKRVFITGYASVNCLQSDGSLVALMSEPGAAAALAASPDARPLATIAEGAYADGKITRRMDRFTLMAYVAVRKALDHARVDIPALQADRVGIIMNTCYGPLDSTRRYISKLIRDGAKKVPAAVFPNTVHNAFTGLITMEIKVHGTNSTVSGQNPICYGLDMIREGRDDMMIVGGCDELLATMTHGFAAAGLRNDNLDERAGAGIYDRDGSTFRLGEGAAVLVLESEESALARGATPFAEVLDYGMANGLAGEPGAAFPADVAGIRRAMEQAMLRSSILPEEVGFVSSACNGLPRLARAEIDALDSVFGKQPQPLVGNVKSALGETLGAASVFSTLFAIDSLNAGSVAPAWGVAPGCMPARYVAGQARPAALQLALVNGIELGGTITSLALRKYTI